MERAPCECELAGWCNRHQMTKTEHLHRLCQTRDDYRALWDKKRPVKPSAVKQAWSYVKAVAQWTVAGNPRRTDDEIKQIYDTHCQPCKFFVVKESGGSCKLCGCKLNKVADGLKNKIAMATEHCPDGRW